MSIQGDLTIFDGDTIEIGPVLIRLHDIDAPEKGQTCATTEDRTWPCGVAAIQRLEALVEKQSIVCDPLDRDPYGRIIARCTVNGMDIAETLVSEGLACFCNELALCPAICEFERGSISAVRRKSGLVKLRRGASLHRQGQQWAVLNRAKRHSARHAAHAPMEAESPLRPMPPSV